MGFYITVFILLFLVAHSINGHRDHDHGHGREPGGRNRNPLPHFRKNELSPNFQAFKVPSTCSEKSKHCINGIHEHARKCDQMFVEEKRSEINECEFENEELRTLNMEWQVASTVWHTAIDDCLKGERPPTRTGGVSGMSNDGTSFIFRRKREIRDPNFCRSEENHHQPEYESSRQCWIDFKAHRNKCGGCLAQDPGCQKLK